MEKKKATYHDFIDKEYTAFRKGIDMQREIYKASMHEKDYDGAVTSLDNIKIEIRNKVLARGNKDKIKKIDRVLVWYRLLPFKYTKPTEHGNQLVYPAGIELRIIKNLNAVYGIITEQLSNLGLI